MNEEAKKFKRKSKSNIFHVKLCLVDFSIKRLDNKVRKIKYVKNTPLSTNRYVIAGDIVDIKQHPRYEDSLQVVVNCGLFVQTRIYKRERLKHGDFIKAEGRLDAYITDGEVH